MTEPINARLADELGSSIEALKDVVRLAEAAILAARDFDAVMGVLTFMAPRMGRAMDDALVALGGGRAGVFDIGERADGRNEDAKD